ncbi:MAG: CinA-like protein [Bacteroidales bacterium]
MNTEIITIGDELLIGQVVDTNSAWMGRQLGNEGFRVTQKTAVGDTEADILSAIDCAMHRVQIVLLTGGIGPTKDDITRQTLCRFFNSGLHFSAEVYENILQMFNRSGRRMNELTRNQAMVPDRCTAIPNKAGTAPCMWFERDGKALVAMPGVPYEMKWLMTNEVIPRLKERFRRDMFIRHQTVWVSGYSESSLALELARFEEELPSFVKLAYLPQQGIIRLRLSAYAASEREAAGSISEQTNKLHSLLAGHIFAEDDRMIEERIGEELATKRLTMGTAESCTGGRIASMITSVPGSSHYYKGSVIAYSNEVKRNVLGVSETDLRQYGAVSRQVAEQMAAGVARTLGSDCAVATTGIAGPGGGTPDKPVGTVWIAAIYKDKLISECYHFGAIREINIVHASNTALLLLLRLIKN